MILRCAVLGCFVTRLCGHHWLYDRAHPKIRPFSPVPFTGIHDNYWRSASHPRDLLPLIGINITPQRDPTPFTFAIGNLIIGVGLFHYRLLDLVPIARERVLENMTDAIIVLDASNRVVDMNHAALANAGKRSPEVIGRPAQEVFAAWPGLREQTQKLDDAALEVSAVVQGEHRMYDLSISSIRDQRNRLIGRVFVAHDITARKMLEERYRMLSEELEQRVLERTENLRVNG
jgi:PAS domain S-box-containing protein